MGILAADLGALRTISAEWQARRLRWPNETGRGVLVDAFTASRVLAVHDAVNDDNKAKIARMVARDRASFARVVQIALRE